MKIDLHIKELVLEGFPPGDRHRIGAAVERELARLLAERDLPASLAAVRGIAKVDGGRFEMNRGATPETVGGQVARAVHGGMSRER